MEEFNIIWVAPSRFNYWYEVQGIIDVLVAGDLVPAETPGEGER